jgi:hypothetical protein
MTNDSPYHAYYREKARDLPGPCPGSIRKEVPAWAKDRYPTWEEFTQAIHDRKSVGW